MAVSGSVTVKRVSGELETVERRSRIFVGDTLLTGPDQFVQLRFADSAILSLFCNSNLKVNDYVYQDSNSDRVHLSLLSGGARTITGSIQTKNYLFSSEVANVKVSGADFEVATRKSSQSNGDFLNLEFAVFDGTITVENEYGTLALDASSQNYMAQVIEGFGPEPISQFNSSVCF